MINIILITVLCISFITDIRYRKIFNNVTYPTILISLVYYGFHTGTSGVLFSVLGLLTGLLLFMFPFLLGGIGAGDVKLLGVIGALKGTHFVFFAFLYTCIVGGIIALFLLVYQRRLKCLTKRIYLMMNLKSMDTINKNEFHSSFPYGVPIVIGTLIQLGVEWF
ncbi:A24 family peptidase [Salirhabdus salicampi]|uniref:A24 family peptidase n=1 Tax=Salirhabdus salicampi TaxID=476102 RepID=UPI0020C3AD6C|nr:A24 family peptidase [Salirhabdus salicampi]MCP8616130.1 A24 family peptidase [Salirhabdus salicampi]